MLYRKVNATASKAQTLMRERHVRRHTLVGNIQGREIVTALKVWKPDSGEIEIGKGGVSFQTAQRIET